MVKKLSGVNANRVHLTSDGMIEVIIAGKQSVASMNSLRYEIEKLSAELRANNKKILVLVDIAALRVDDANATVRAASRELLKLPADGAAVLGNNSLMTIVLYMLKVARPTTPIKYFTNRHKALAWLHGEVQPKVSRPTVSLVGSIGIALLAIVTLIGWQTRNIYLTDFITPLPSMNPMAAVGLLVIAWGFLSFWRGDLRSLRISGVLGITLGLMAFLPFGVDHWLYGGRVTEAGPHAGIADSAALCFIAMGTVGLLAGRQKMKQQGFLLVNMAVAVLASLSLFNIFGQLYAHDFIYGLSDDFVMSLNLAVAFAIATTSLILLVVYRRNNDVLGQVTKVGWLIVAALIGIQFATYAAWAQAVNHNQMQAASAFNDQVHILQNSVNTRLQIYTQALQGFRGFFAASDTVTQGDFQSYYQALGLTKNFAGLRSMAFIAAVPDKDVASFIKKRQQDTSLSPLGNPDFTVINRTAAPVHYVATYSANGDMPVTTGLGLDLTSIPGRQQIYSSAIASGQSYASGTITFLKTATQPAQKGFFITIPVRRDGSSQYLGVVNANFSYKDFFPTLFKDTNLRKNLLVAINDKSTVIYRSNLMHGAASQTTNLGIPVANNVWYIHIEAGQRFGISDNQTHLPLEILIAGQVLAAFVGIIFLLQSRARRQALDLASAVTADLQQERNHIIELHQKDEAILSGIGEGLVAMNHRGIIERVNRAAQQLLGMTEDELVGKELAEYVLAADMEGVALDISKRPVTQALEKQKTINAKLKYTRKNGRQFPVELNVAPVILHGKAIGAIEVFRDITHDYELDKAKSEFVSLASHQLRTPLSATNWYSEMLLNGDAGKISTEQAEYLREIYEGNQRMIELVNSLLDVSRLELGRMANNPEPTSMTDLVTAIEKELVTGIKTKQLVFEKQLAADLTPVLGDPKLLRMVVQNLLSNAVKYTADKGSVLAIVRPANSRDVHAAKLPVEGSYVLFSVKDNGYGIPPEQQKHIFEKLFRADNVRKLDVEGTGLGLYIVKQVVETMGGRVWFESHEGVGTTFSVVLPIKTRVWKMNET